MNMRAFLAETIGTFWLVFAGLGTALFAAGIADIGVGLLGVSVAFMLLIITMAYAIGHISGCHLNPAVTIGLFAGGRVGFGSVIPYIIAQCIGAIGGAALLMVIGTGLLDGGPGIEGFALAGASNGFGEHSMVGAGMMTVLLVEAVLTAVFLYVIMGATGVMAPKGFAPLAIGGCLGLIHLISIPISNTSVNPARSLGTALMDGQAWSLEQLWVFIAAPIVGGIVGAVIYRIVNAENE